MAEGIPINVDAAVQRGSLSWLRNGGIVKLNCILVLSLISSYATGFDGSMVSTSSNLLGAFVFLPNDQAAK